MTNPYEHKLPPAIEDVDADLTYAEACASDGLSALQRALRALGTSEWLDLYIELKDALDELQDAATHLRNIAPTCETWAGTMTD